MSQFVTYVALREPASLDADALADAIRSRFGDAIPGPVTPAGGLRTDGAMVLDIAGVPMAVMLIGKPLPRDVYSGAMTLERQWTTAKRDLATSGAHAIVAPLETAGGHAQALATAKRLTFVVAALLERIPAVDVLWSEGDRLIAADAFLAAANEMKGGDAPFLCWMNLIFLRGPDAAGGRPTAAVLTKGLLPFIGREIEFGPSILAPGQMARRVILVTQHLVERGPVIGDGGTLEIEPGETVVAAFAAEGQRTGVPVLRLTLRPGSDSKRRGGEA